MKNNNDVTESAAENDVIEAVVVENVTEAGTITEATAEVVTKATETTEANAEQSQIAALKEALTVAEKKASDNYDLALRTKAESDNARRRQENDLSNARKFGVEKFAVDLLPVIDSMEMGLLVTDGENVDIDKIREGSEMAIKMFAASLAKIGAVAVSPEGEKFNPDLHQAMSMVENLDLAPNTVMNVIQKGYTLNGRLMRPAMVIVSKGGPAKPAEGGSIDEIV